MEPVIPHNRPTLGDAEVAAAERVIRSRRLAAGREVAALEAAFCVRLGLPPGHAVATSSGTAALFLALFALEVRGRRVGVPVYACQAVRDAVAMAGATPILLDSAADSPNIDAAAIRSGGVDAAVAVDSFGLPCDAGCFEVVPTIEDAAQALGAADGVPLGLRGRAGIFSMYATKMITSGGQGGMVVSSDLALVEAVRDYLDFDGRHDDRRRFNLQLTDLNAAIGRVQLDALDGFIERRAAIFAAYQAAGLTLIESAHGTPVRYRAVMRAEPRAVIDRLRAAGIHAIVPIEDWELNAPLDAFPHAARLTATTVSLPCYPTLTDAELERVIAALAPLH